MSTSAPLGFLSMSRKRTPPLLCSSASNQWRMVFGCYWNLALILCHKWVSINHINAIKNGCYLSYYAIKGKNNNDITLIMMIIMITYQQNHDLGPRTPSSSETPNLGKNQDWLWGVRPCATAQGGRVPGAGSTRRGWTRQLMFEIHSWNIINHQ